MKCIDVDEDVVYITCNTNNYIKKYKSILSVHADVVRSMYFDNF